MSMNICISNSSCSSVSRYLFSVYITIYACDEFIDVLDVTEELNLLTSPELEYHFILTCIYLACRVIANQTSFTHESDSVDYINVNFVTRPKPGSPGSFQSQFP